MKFVRTISLMLVFLIAVSPALANNCMAHCATQSAISSSHVKVLTNKMSGMINCHEYEDRHFSKSSNNSADTSHKSCAMGVGCHYSQVLPVLASIKYSPVTIESTLFPKLVSTEKSLDLSPPLKPPA